MTLPKSLHLRWLLTIGWGAVILLFSSDSGSSGHSLGILHHLFDLLPATPHTLSGDENYLFRKCMHMAEYGLLSAFLLTTFCGTSPSLRSGLRVLLVVFLCACLDESYQTFVPGRHGQFPDVLVDISGALAVLAAFAATAPLMGPRLPGCTRTQG